MSSQSKKPVAVRTIKQNANASGVLYFTVGTQQIDADGNLFISEDIIKESLNDSITQDLVERGVIVVLEGEILEEYKAEKFAYIDANGGSTASVRKVKEQESTIAEMAKKIAAYEAAQSKVTKGKGVSND